VGESSNVTQEKSFSDSSQKRICGIEECKTAEEKKVLRSSFAQSVSSSWNVPGSGALHAFSVSSFESLERPVLSEEVGLPMSPLTEKLFPVFAF
jgi:hypothetical protein